MKARSKKGCSFYFCLMKLVGIVFLLGLLPGCVGSSVLKAHRTSIFDEYMVMGNKSYKLYIDLLLIRLVNEKGQYTISGDTIYLLSKKNKNIYEMNAFALVDTGAKTVTYIRDSNYTKDFKLHYYRPLK
jgi:hypothetical protein